jgi:hypothetical protein
MSIQQKKKIEDFIDTITLRLSYTKTPDWLQSWLKATRRAEIVDLFFVLVGFGGGLAFLVFVEWGCGRPLNQDKCSLGRGVGSFHAHMKLLAQ